MSAIDNKETTGILIKKHPRGATIENVEYRAVPASDQVKRRGAHRLAFAGLFIFTLFLYMRPNDLFPEIFGTFPIVRIIAISTLVAYFISKVTNGERLMIWPIEMKMLAVITLLGIIFIPIAAAPQESIDLLLDTFLKVVAIFVLMINLINTSERLRLLWKMVVICGGILALIAINSYLAGDFAYKFQGEGFRIGGPKGFFRNPNDLAVVLVLLLPLAVAMALIQKGMARVVYFACAVLLTTGVVVTFSRGGFLGLVAVGAVLLWKVGRGNRFVTTLAFTIILGVFMSMVPGSYANRVVSIFDQSQDTTGSGQARRDLLERATAVASNHLVIGVGMGNFHIYSLREQVAHNSYLEISSELGVAGLIAYLILIFASLRSMRRVERESVDSRSAHPFVSVVRKNKTYHLAVALQAAIVGYMVCSFFGSIQYHWFLYFFAAFAIALRRIHDAEQAEFEADDERQDETEEKPGGALWKQHSPANRTTILQG